jgi:hypothetical protein
LEGAAVGAKTVTAGVKAVTDEASVITAGIKVITDKPPAVAAGALCEKRAIKSYIPGGGGVDVCYAQIVYPTHDGILRGKYRRVK